MLGLKTIEDFSLAECEEFLKRADISDEERQNAEKRKDELLHASQQQNKAEIEEFIKQGYSPSNLFVEKLGCNKPYLKAIGILLMFLGVILFFGSRVGFNTSKSLAEEAEKSRAFSEQMKKQFDGRVGTVSKYESLKQSSERTRKTADICVYASVFCLIAGFVVLLINNVKENTLELLNSMDYLRENDLMQDKGSCFFIKDHKYGVADFNRKKVIIPPKYDKLLWEKRGSVLLAEIDGRQFYIDIQGNKLK